MNLLLLGINHRTASLELREKFAVDDPKPLLEKLLRTGDILEAVLLSTCNRVEICAVAETMEVGELSLRSFFGRSIAPDHNSFTELDEAFYCYRGEEAARHLFRVASSIDSMVVGEPQILGQLKEAYREAGTSGACSSKLSRVYQMAFSAAKRVRNETEIALRPVSVAKVAVELALGVFERLDDKTALLVGAGDMIDLALQALRSSGLSQVRVANRTKGRAEELASRFNATAHDLKELEVLATTSDIILTSIAGKEPVFCESLIRKVLSNRDGRPLFIIDIGVPRNVESSADDLENLFRYDMDDLAAVAERNEMERRGEVESAERIIEQEVTKFREWISAQGFIPIIQSLRSRAESIRQKELNRYLNRMSLNPQQAAQADALTKGLVNKLLHEPLSKLRAPGEDSEDLLRAAELLFALDRPATEVSVSDSEEE